MADYYDQLEQSEPMIDPAGEAFYEDEYRVDGVNSAEAENEVQANDDYQE
jgi:hypothetical protein